MLTLVRRQIVTQLIINKALTDKIGMQVKEEEPERTWNGALPV